MFSNTKLSSEMLKKCEEETGENVTHTLKNHQMVRERKEGRREGEKEEEREERREGRKKGKKNHMIIQMDR